MDERGISSNNLQCYCSRLAKQFPFANTLNSPKARKRLAKAYLKVSRPREDFAHKQASTLITSHDLIAYEDLKIANMVRNHDLAKSISDVSWGRFLAWLKYYAALHATLS